MNPKIIQNIDDFDSDGVTNDLDPNPYINKDSDSDGLSDDYEEVISGTNLTNSDTDGDGYDDGLEIEKDTDPLDKDDHPEEAWITFDNITIFRISIITIISILLFIIIMTLRRRAQKSK